MKTLNNYISKSRNCRFTNYRLFENSNDIDTRIAQWLIDAQVVYRKPLNTVKGYINPDHTINIQNLREDCDGRCDVTINNKLLEGNRIPDYITFDGPIDFLYNPELSIADGGFRDLIKGKTRLNRIGTDVHVFNDIDNKDVWGNVRVDNFTVYFNEDVPLPDNFQDLIPQCDNLILDGRYSKSAAIKRQIRKFKMNGLKPCVVFAWK